MSTEKTLRSKLIAAAIKGGGIVVSHLDEICRNARQVNEALLMKQLRKNSHTEYGLKYGFENIHDVDEYRRIVPLTEYPDYAPYVKRMLENNEKNLITSDSVECYFVSSGTSGVDKQIPATSDTLKILRNYVSAYQFGMISRCVGDIWTDGAILNLTEVREHLTKFGIYIGCLSGWVIRGVGNMAFQVFVSPKEAIYSKAGEDTFYLHLLAALASEDVSEIRAPFIAPVLELFRYLEKNWKHLVEDIESGSIGEDVQIAPETREVLLKRMKPNPERASVLRTEFDRGFDEPIAPRIWKKFACVSAVSGAGFAPYLEQCRRYIGKTPVFNYGITATEGLFAVPYAMDNPTYIMTPDTCFYEFEPVDGESGKTVLLDEVEIGRDYRLIITNTSGFYRYQMKDILRIVGRHGNSPVVEFLCRDAHLTSICGEKTNEKLLLYSMEEAAGNIRYVDFSVYSDPDAKPHGHYVFLVELLPGQSRPNPDAFGLALRVAMSKRSHDLENFFERGWLGTPKVCFLKPGTYQRYRSMQTEKKGVMNQIKPVRMLNTAHQREWFLNQIDFSDGE